MDLTFDIKNSSGDHVIVALTCYDKKSVSVLSSDVRILDVDLYDVTLYRKSGNGYVGTKIILNIINTLAKFLKENPSAVLTFYCDPILEVSRNHKELPPQEYRSKLFTRMFDMFTRFQNDDKFINKIIKVEDIDKTQYAHFIFRRDHEAIVNILKDSILEGK